MRLASQCYFAPRAVRSLLLVMHSHQHAHIFLCVGCRYQDSAAGCVDTNMQHKVLERGARILMLFLETMVLQVVCQGMLSGSLPDIPPFGSVTHRLRFGMQRFRLQKCCLNCIRLLFH
jgi:hypothetical protein